MRQALDRLAQRAWTNRKGLPEPALDRNTSNPMLSPRTNPQAFLDPPSPAVIPSSGNRQSAAHNASNRNNATALNRRDGATGHRRDSATSRDMTGARSSCGHHTVITHTHHTHSSHTLIIHSRHTVIIYRQHHATCHWLWKDCYRYLVSTP